MSESARQLIFVGLGNPGKDYEMTRHNIGQIVIFELAKSLGLAFKNDSHFESEVVKGSIDKTKIHLLFPKTYMNESGRALRRYLDFHKLSPKEVVIISDDVDLPFGEIRLRESGGPGSHNGLKSIEKYLGSKDYIRLRMGIGKQPEKQELSDYVLSRFNAEESAILDLFVKQGALILKRIASEDIKHLMNDINKKVNKTKKLDLLQKEGQE